MICNNVCNINSKLYNVHKNILYMVALSYVKIYPTKNFEEALK